MSAQPDPAAADPANPLVDLFERCVVAVFDGAGAFRGSGFFVAPGELLTCAHVVHGLEAIEVGWDGRRYAATVEQRLPQLDAGDPAARFHPLPDVALLRLAEPPESHPCVRLDAAEPVAAPVADMLRLCAFSVGEHERQRLARSSATTTFEGPFDEDGQRLLKLAAGRVIGGFSGAPLLNVRTGSVCGVVESTRDDRQALGGFGVPLSSFVASLPGLADCNTAHHRAAPRYWEPAVEAERVAAAGRDGIRDGLRLSPPQVELDADADVAASELLRPRRAAVPLVGRSELMEQLMLWRESDGRLAVTIVTGAGGFGKTRLAAELCAAAEDAGWMAGLLGVEASEASLDAIAAWPGRLLVAIDYAETRPDVAVGLLLALRRHRRLSPARIVLVVRQVSARDELRRIFNPHAVEELTDLLGAAEIVRLDDRARHELDRGELFETAVRAFALVRGVTPPARARPPSLRAEHFGRPLFVLVAALLAVHDPTLDVDALTIEALLGTLLDEHESAYWERWDTRLAVGLAPDDRRRAVALAALLGAGSEDEAITVVRLVPGLADASDERVRAVARWLSHLYGSGSLDDRPAITALEPDLLTEVLAASALRARPALLGASLDAGSDAQIERGLLVLSRIAAIGGDVLEHAIRDALDARLAGLVRRLPPSGGRRPGRCAATRDRRAAPARRRRRRRPVALLAYARPARPRDRPRDPRGQRMARRRRRRPLASR